ncbi:MAG: peroxiredoxin [Acidobacteriaceae bacterium]
MKMLVSAMVLLFASALFAGNMPTAGSTAPDFSLKSQDGSTVSLNDLHGKWVVLYFYPKDFTSGCTVEAHNFQRDLEQYKHLNAMIVGVSLDSAESHKQFCVKEGLDFKLLSDSDQKVSKEYGVLGSYKDQPMAMRNTFLIDPNGKIARTFPDVKPQQHSEEVLAALKELSK